MGEVCDSSSSLIPDYLAFLFLNPRRTPAGEVCLWIFPDGRKPRVSVFSPVTMRGNYWSFHIQPVLCQDLNSVTRLQQGHCWQFLQPHPAQLCKPAGNNKPATAVSHWILEMVGFCRKGEKEETVATLIKEKKKSSWKQGGKNLVSVHFYMGN